MFEHLDFSRERKKLLIDEGSIMASLNHERVVKLLGVILEDRDCSLVMELIPRGNLLVMLQTVSRLYISKENIQLTISSLGSLLLLFLGFISHLLACLQVSVPLSVKGRITLEILEAMVYLSENDIIHKDIKPENILVDKDFHIKVCSAVQLLIRSRLHRSHLPPRLQTLDWPYLRLGANSPRRSLAGRVTVGRRPGREAPAP